jgi:hypothetical protein
VEFRKALLYLIGGLFILALALAFWWREDEADFQSD